MSLIGYALRMAKQYYEPKTYDHAIRVATYVAENPMIPNEIMDDCIALGIMHDLIEDTDYEKRAKDDLYNPNSNLTKDKHFFNCLSFLTKEVGEDYIGYIKKIKEVSDDMPEVYWVKLADMKDHLAQTETLTEKLRDKYLAALPYLL